MHERAKLEKIKIRRKQHLLQLMFKQKERPFLWKNKRRRRSGAVTRNSLKHQFALKRTKTERYKKSITNEAPQLWNSLPAELQNAQELRLFKYKLKQYLTPINPAEMLQ